MRDLGLLSGGAMLALSIAMLALIFYYAVALLRYAMAPYLLWKEPRLRVREALRLSRERMWGNKAAYFRLSLSYIGWYLLEAVAIRGFAAFLRNCTVAPIPANGDLRVPDVHLHRVPLQLRIRRRIRLLPRFGNATGVQGLTFRLLNGGRRARPLYFFIKMPF